MNTDSAKLIFQTKKLNKLASDIDTGAVSPQECVTVMLSIVEALASHAHNISASLD